MKQVPVGVSARHIHFSQEHIDILFGQGYELTELKPCHSQVNLQPRKRWP